MTNQKTDEKLHKLIVKIVNGIIARDEPFDPDDINPDSNLLESYGMDSLTFIDKAMSLEEYFDIDIDDGKIEDLVTSNKLTAYIIQTTDQKILKNIKSDTDVNKALVEICPNENDTSKQIRHILTSTFQANIQSDLKLQVNSVYILLSKILRNNKIYHISSIPNMKNDVLLCSYVVFLTKRQIFYICLQKMRVDIREIPLSILSIESNCFYESDGSLTRIDLICDVKDVDEKGFPRKYNYTVPADHVETTVKLLGKINEYKEKIYHS